MTLRTFVAALAVSAPVFAQTTSAVKGPSANSLWDVPSSEFNQELPSWLKFSGAYQGRFEGFTHGGYKKDNSDAYFLNRFRINMNLNATSWLRFSFQMQDAREYGKNTGPLPPFQDTVDLRVAYVEIGDSEKKQWGLRAGRQELVFGDQRLIGHLNWVNTARSFDAVRGTYHFKGGRMDATRVDVFASTVVQQAEGEFDRAFRTKADNLHGIWVNIPKLAPNMVIEPYVLWRVTRGLKSETGLLGNRDFKTYGIRFVGKVGKTPWDYNIEMNKQKGSLANDDISAWAGHWMLGYTTPKIVMKPKWMLEYNYASGDKNPTDGKRGTFDQLYPTGHDKLGFADQVGWKNVHNIQVAASMKPSAKLTFVPRYHWLWLAQARDYLYAANGVAVVRSADGSAGRFIGTELDLTASYAATKQATVSFGYAHLFPGTFLKKTTQGYGYNFPFVMLGYNF